MCPGIPKHKQSHREKPCMLSKHSPLLSSVRFFPKQNDPKTILSMNTQEIKSLFLNARQNFRQQFSREEE